MVFTKSWYSPKHWYSPMVSDQATKRCLAEKSRDTRHFVTGLVTMLETIISFGYFVICIL
jgi:hypothetical protein